MEEAKADYDKFEDQKTTLAADLAEWEQAKKDAATNADW